MTYSSPLQHMLRSKQWNGVEYITCYRRKISPVQAQDFAGGSSKAARESCPRKQTAFAANLNMEIQPVRKWRKFQQFQTNKISFGALNALFNTSHLVNDICIDFSIYERIVCMKNDTVLGYESSYYNYQYVLSIISFSWISSVAISR